MDDVEVLKDEIEWLKEELAKAKLETERVKKWNKWFYGRVKFMRECQKGYFRDRSQDRLQQSKAVELEIDHEIQRIEAALLKRTEIGQKVIEEFDAVQVEP